jgi:hypothetical protein
MGPGQRKRDAGDRATATSAEKYERNGDPDLVDLRVGVRLPGV